MQKLQVLLGKTIKLQKVLKKAKAENEKDAIRWSDGPGEGSRAGLKESKIQPNSPPIQK